MELNRNGPPISVQQQTAAVYLLAAGVGLAVFLINVAPGVSCLEGGPWAGRPFPYAHGCLSQGGVPIWTAINGGALWANAMIWGLVFGAVALAARLAWSLPRFTPDSRPVPGRPRSPGAP